MKKDDLTEEQLRIKAMKLYENHWKVSEICSTLECSRTWFYKWLKRYRANDPDWYQEESRAPKTNPKKIPSKMEEHIIETRKDLISKPYCQYGPQAIHYALAQQGITPPPPIWLIARTLKRHNLTYKKRSASYTAKGKKYPYEYLLCHQMDFVGPRYLHSKERFYFHNLICCDTHYAQATACDNQSAELTCNSLIRFWKTVGIPDFLQMDNDLSFWGSLIKPNALGKLIRLCLIHRVTPVFIPVKEPWRNGIIEHFNRTMQSAILNSANYDSMEEVQKAALQFCEIHNQTHHYSTQNGMTPKQCMENFNYPLSTLDNEYTLSKKPLPLESGEIHVIRFIRSDLKFTIFGLSFPLPEKTKYEYIKGVIVTEEHKLIIFKDQEYIMDFPFILYE